MKISSGSIVTAAFAVGATVASVILYDVLPARIPIHWNLYGQPDGWGDKWWAAFQIPAMITLLLLMEEGLPRLRRSGAALAPFLTTFYYVVGVSAGLMAFLHSIALTSALHPHWNMARPLLSGILVAMALIGNVMGKIRRNPYVGVRTAWTLSSDAVWIATHRLAAHLLFAVGLAGAIGIWLGVPPAACVGALLLALLLPAGYSWLVYERLGTS